MRRTFALLATVSLFAVLIGCGGSGSAPTADSGAGAPTAPPGPPPGMAQSGGGTSAPAMSSDESDTYQETMSAETASSDPMDDYVPPEEDTAPGDSSGQPPGYPGAMGGPPPGYPGAMSGRAPGSPGSMGGPPPGYPGRSPRGYSGSSEEDSSADDGMDMYAEEGMTPYPDGSYPGYPGGGYPGYPGGPGMGSPTPPPPPGLDALAQMAFQQGRESDGFKYLCGYALLNDEGAADVLPKMEWVNGLKGPVLGVRWGVGVQITPDSYKGNVWPVGTSQQFPGTRTRGGGGGGGGGSYGGEGSMPTGEYGGGPGAAGGGNVSALFNRFSGELGERFLNEFQTRVFDGQFGQILRDAPAAGSRRGAGGYGGEYGEGGMYGGSMPYGSSEGPGYGPGMAGGGGARPQAPGAAVPITTGLCFLGVEPQDRLLTKAAREGLQVLLLVNVDVQVNVKTKVVNNDTELVLFDVAKKIPLHSTAKFNNVKIQNNRQGSKKDGVQDEFNKLFKYVDDNLTVLPVPSAIKPEHVQGRVSSLLAAKHDNLLPVLVEIRYWQRQNMLTEEEMVAAFKQLLGEENGNQLATGDEETRKKLLEKYLPRA